MRTWVAGVSGSVPSPAGVSPGYRRRVAKECAMAGALRRSGFPLGVLVLVCATADAREAGAPLQPRPTWPEVTRAAHHDASPPLWLLPPAPKAPPRADYEPKRLPRPLHREGPQADPVLQDAVPPGLAPLALVNVEGVGNGFTGPAGTFTVDAAPPDTNGDVGPNHYVQTVNTDFAVLDKAGTPLFGPVPINTLWSGFGGDCQTNNDGDP